MKTESPANSDGNRPHRVRSREQTAADLWAAVERLQSNEGMPTIADVARDVGVTPALIHNRYPTSPTDSEGWLARIRAAGGRTSNHFLTRNDSGPRDFEPRWRN